MATIDEKIQKVRENLTKQNRLGLYQVERFLNKETRARVGLRVKAPIFPQDPAVAASNKKLGPQYVDVRWEPALSDGPTSARVAVVDYNADTGTLGAPAVWNSTENRFADEKGKLITPGNTKSLQFDQVNVWAIVEGVLARYLQGVMADDDVDTDSYRDQVEALANESLMLLGEPQ